MSNKQLVQLYDKLTFEGFDCLYGIKEDIGVTKDFSIKEMSFEDIWTFEFDRLKHIIIMGDTHDFTRLDEVINAINFKVDTLIHAGDYGTAETTMESISRFKGNFYGVLGNHDRQFSAAYLPYLGNGNKIKIGYDILYFNLPFQTQVHLRHENEGLEKLYLQQSDIFPDTKSLVIYGHSHKPAMWKKGKITILNAGILCDAGNNQPTFCIYDIRNPIESVFVRL